ncbi:MAG TPA: hypothetical protein PK916_08860 [Bacteroidota bacterium]|nr:hypothetical protein [Bacteroidota bacterium]
MAKHVHRQFARGRITDGDSNDIPGDALLECVNFDLDTGIGEARPRPGLAAYTDLGAVPTVDDGPYDGTSDALPACPNSGEWRIWNVVRWDSGIVTVQHNTMLIYREYATGAWQSEYAVYSNAPNGGNGNLFALLTPTPLSVPFCRPRVINGQVRLALGPEDDYLIHLNLCEEGARTYPTFTITSADDRSEALGAGGNVRQGWLWDWGKPYWSGTTAGAYDLGSTSSILVSLADATTAARPALEFCGYKLALVPVLDEYDAQFSTALVVELSKDYWGANGNKVFELTFNITDDNYNKRITHFAIYGMRIHRTDRVDHQELRRLYMIPFSALVGSQTYYIDDTMFESPEGVWSADSKGRPITLHWDDAVASLATNITRLSPLASHLDDEISVKPSGFMIRRKRLFAWGVNSDPGQTRIAVSALDTNDSAQLDVFWKLNRIWREGSSATVWLEEYMDRMFLWNTHNSYFIDLEHRLDDQVMTLDVGYGIGTPYEQTITRGGSALYWLNDDGVYRFTGSSPENILIDSWYREYLALPRSAKASAVVGYHDERDELWLVLNVSEDPVFAPYTVVYVYSVADANWRCYKFFWTWTANADEMNLEIRGMFTDAQRRHVLYGRIVSSGSTVLLRFGNETRLDDGGGIPCYLESHWIGTRDAWQKPHKCYVARDAGSASRPFTLSMYANRENAAYATITFPSTRNRLARLRARTVREYKFGVRVDVDASTIPASLGGYRDPVIQQITIETTDETMRST